MDDATELKAEIKKLNLTATRLTIDLHDLAEDLPTGWEDIMATARRTYECYAEIDRLRRRLAELHAS